MDEFITGLSDGVRDDWETIDSDNGSQTENDTYFTPDDLGAVPYNKLRLLGMIQSATMCGWECGTDDFRGRDVPAATLKQVAYYRLIRAALSLSDPQPIHHPAVIICRSPGSIQCKEQVLPPGDEWEDAQILPCIVSHTLHDVELRQNWDHELVPGALNNILLARCACTDAGPSHGHGQDMVKERFAEGMLDFAYFWNQYEITDTEIHLLLPDNVDRQMASNYRWEMVDRLCDERGVFGPYAPIEDWSIPDVEKDIRCDACGQGCLPPFSGPYSCNLYRQSDQQDTEGEDKVIS